MAALAEHTDNDIDKGDTNTQSGLNEQYKLLARGLEHREHFVCQDLMAKYPPKFRDRRKKALFASIAPNGVPKCPGTLTYARYQKVDLPATFADPTDFIKKQLILKPTIFEYHSNTEDPSTCHFYVNFADVNLFGFYSGSLFAQDELQTMEHPVLCSLRERLVAAHSKKEAGLSIACRGSVIITNAVKHFHFSQKSLDSLYGNKFSTSSVETVQKKVTVCNPPIIDNIVAIAAFMCSRRKYEYSDIDRLLKTAYCGFNGAVCEVIYEEMSNVETAEDEEVEEQKEKDIAERKKRIVLHTGHWGCGAFGGNMAVHAMIQIVAAIAAGIDMVEYHCVGEQAVTKIQEAMGVLVKEICPKCKDKNGRIVLDKFIKSLLKLGYKWGTPNGT